MLNIIVFSRDRACQLELFLRSMKYCFAQFKEFPVNVLYQYSDMRYQDGYSKLAGLSDFPKNVNMVKEISFQGDLIELLSERNPYTVFFVDDMVWKEMFSLKGGTFSSFTNDPDVLCLSLRLMRGLQYCYPLDTFNEMPRFDYENKWFWQGLVGDYGYPMSLDGHIFRTGDILDIVLSFKCNSPNRLEAKMALNPLHKRQKMVCCDISPVMNIPLNIVQDSWNNRHGSLSSLNLNKRFLSGERISTENIYGIKNSSCHQIIDIKFEQYG